MCSGLGNCIACKRFVVQTFLWLLEFVINQNLEYDINDISYIFQISPCNNKKGLL